LLTSNRTVREESDSHPISAVIASIKTRKATKNQTGPDAPGIMGNVFISNL
jgi:hypothetical protein